MSAEQVEDLVASCLDRMASGSIDALEELCRLHPDHADELRRHIARAEAMGLVGDGPDVEARLPRGAFGGFKILGEIGRGGMGVVYLAEQEELNRQVALKVLRPEYHMFDGAVERFRREARAIGRLQHPGVIPIHTIGVEDGIPYYAMELIQGASLDLIVESLSKWTPPEVNGHRFAESFCAVAGVATTDTGPKEKLHQLFEGSWETIALRIVRQVAFALDYVHECGVLHRDIKPSNIMVTPAGRVVLLDFGLARDDRMSRMTRSGHQPGSLPYMAPEQIRGEGELDARTDVFALGVVLRELLTLASPFESTSAEETRRRILGGRLEPVRHLNPTISRDAETVCHVALTVERKLRYQTAASLAHDVGCILQGLPIMARRPVLAARLWRQARRNPVGATAIVLAFLVVVVGPALFGLQQHRSRLEIESEQNQTRLQRDQATEARNEATEAHHESRALARKALATTRFLRTLMEGTGGWLWIKREGGFDALDREGQALVAELNDLPAQQSDVLEEMAEVFWSLSFRERAIELYGRSIATRRTIADELPLAHALGQRAFHLVEMERDWQMSRRDAREIILLLQDYDQVAANRTLARAHTVLASVHARDGNLKSSAESIETAIAILDSLEQDPLESAVQAAAASLIRFTLARMWLDTGAHSKAGEQFEHLLDGESEDWFLRPQILASLGTITASRGDGARAAELFASSMSEADRVLSRSDPRTATFRGDLGLTLFQARRYTDSAKLLETTLQTLERAGTFRSLAARYACCLSSVLAALRRPGAAITQARKAVELRRMGDGRFEPEAAHCLYGLCVLALRQGKQDEAISAAQQALEVLETRDDPVAARFRAYCYRDIGGILLAKRSWAKAIEALERALPYYRGAKELVDRRSLAVVLDNMAKSHVRLRNKSAARSSWRASLEVGATLWNDDGRFARHLLRKLAGLATEENDHEAAVGHLRKAAE